MNADSQNYQKELKKQSTVKTESCKNVLQKCPRISSTDILALHLGDKQKIMNLDIFQILDDNIQSKNDNSKWSRKL